MTSEVQTDTLSLDLNIERFLFIGREPLRHRLRKFEERLENSYLFTGPPGAGKLDLALYFARAILCPEHGCGTCSSCRATSFGTHPDIIVLNRSSNFIELGDVRATLKFATQTPAVSSHRVVLIPEIHLGQRSAPTLLKTVEEPPATTIFLFTAESVEDEVVPIASRCIQVKVPRFSEEGVRAYLETVETSLPSIETMIAGSAGRLDFARALVTNQELVKYLETWAGVLSKIRTSPWLLSELAQKLEPIPLAQGSASRAEKATQTRRKDADQISMGMNYLLRSIIATRPVNSYLATQAKTLLTQAHSSLRLNISTPLVLRELIFSLAHTVLAAE